MTASSPPRSSPVALGPAEGTYLYFALACAFTWVCGAPMARATMRGLAPSEAAMGLVALGAFGPTLVALVLASIRGERAAVFGRWRTNPVWPLVGLLSMPALHLIATLIEVALGGEPAHWFYPPVRPEHVAAMILFSLGEEFGWRGFAYPRLARRNGPVVASLIVGFWWSVWHFAMWVTPTCSSTALAYAEGAAHLIAASVIVAWVFERSGRSMAVAMAMHASGHLDNVFRAPETEVRLRAMRLLVIVVAAVFAARSLAVSRAPYR
jgi:membrane protease YdiL (CAAX protease family)